MGQLRGIAGSAVQGMTGEYNSLAQIGITGSRDGTLTLDQAKFTAAITADPAAVQNVFGKDDGDTASGPADGIARQIQAFSDTFSTDIISARLTGYTNSAKRMDDRIASLETIMDLKEQTLKAQFAAMEKAVTQFQSQGANLPPSSPPCDERDRALTRTLRTRLTEGAIDVPLTELRQYTTHTAQTATPGQLVVMLYDGFLRFCAQGRAAFERGRRRHLGQPLDPGAGHRHGAARHARHDPGRDRDQPREPLRVRRRAAHRRPSRADMAEIDEAVRCMADLRRRGCRSPRPRPAREPAAAPPSASTLLAELRRLREIQLEQAEALAAADLERLSVLNGERLRLQARIVPTDTPALSPADAGRGPRPRRAARARPARAGGARGAARDALRRELGSLRSGRHALRVPPAAAGSSLYLEAPTNTRSHGPHGCPGTPA